MEIEYIQKSWAQYCNWSSYNCCLSHWTVVQLQICIGISSKGKQIERASLLFKGFALPWCLWNINVCGNWPPLCYKREYGCKRGCLWTKDKSINEALRVFWHPRTILPTQPPGPLLTVPFHPARALVHFGSCTGDLDSAGKSTQRKKQ